MDYLGKGRIEAFTDGVFAIVVTLLVLEFRLPELEGPNVATALPAALRELLPVGLGYVLSFVFVTIYWINHHQLFARIRRSDRGLLWCNSLFLLLLAFIPFPTGLLGRYPSVPVAVSFFGWVMAAVGVSFTLLRWYASSRGLLDAALPPQLVQSALRRSALGPVLYSVGALLALLNTLAAIAVYLLIPLLFALPGRLDRHHHPSHPAPSAK